MNDQGAWILGWIGLAIAVVVLNDYPGTAPVVRYSLILVIVYVLLANSERFGPVIERWVATIGARPGPTTARKGAMFVS